MTKKNQPHTRWAGVKATAPGARKVSVLRSRPCHPRKFHLPNAANRQTDAAQQRDQRQNTPHHRIRRNPISNQRLRRPIVGIRIVGAGPEGAKLPMPTTRKTRSIGGSHGDR